MASPSKARLVLSLLPQMIDKKIYTMPQFAKERYGKGVSFFFSFFWLLVYVFVNLTSVAWLGALAMEQILGFPKEYGVPAGFCIQKVNDASVKTVNDLVKIVKDASKSASPVLYIQGVYPSGKKGYFAVPLNEE